MSHDDDRDKPTERPEDLETGGYPPMPPLDKADPDLEQEGETADPPDSGWAGAAQATEEESPRSDDR